MDQIDKFITLREASKISKYNPDYLGYLIRSGKMKGRKVGRNWVTTKDDVNYYLNNLSAISKFTRKPITFKVATIVIAMSLIITFGGYYVFTLVYQNGYEQAQAGKQNVAADVSKQLDQSVENLPQ